MKCAIMQPTFIPWAGYFNLMSQVDVFVFLDDVQFNKRSWQQRNRVIQPSGEELVLSVPVHSKGKYDQKINEVEINEATNWREKHKKTLQLSYSKSLFREELFEIVDKLYEQKISNLSEFNKYLIVMLNELLNINTKIISSSELDFIDTKSAYLVKICRQLDCEIYLSPLGSKTYIEEEQIFQTEGIEVIYQSFQPKEYVQRHSKEFITSLSILDVIANIGLKETEKYIKNMG